MVVFDEIAMRSALLTMAILTMARLTMAITILELWLYRRGTTS